MTTVLKQTKLEPLKENRTGYYYFVMVYII
jgi:hypothetical protein